MSVSLAIATHRLSHCRLETQRRGRRFHRAFTCVIEGESHRSTPPVPIPVYGQPPVGKLLLRSDQPDLAGALQFLLVLRIGAAHVLRRAGRRSAPTQPTSAPTQPTSATARRGSDRPRPRRPRSGCPQESQPWFVGSEQKYRGWQPMLKCRGSTIIGAGLGQRVDQAS